MCPRTKGGSQQQKVRGTSPKEVEDFAGKFKRWAYTVCLPNTDSIKPLISCRYHIKMVRDQYGAGLLEDLSAVQDIMVHHLESIRTEEFNGLAFKVYIKYECFLSKGPYTIKGGKVAGQQEKKVFKLSSAAKDKAVITVCTREQCIDAASQPLMAIIELFHDIVLQRSSWIWNRSMGFDVNVSRKFDQVPMKGCNSDHMIEKMVEAEQEEEKGQNCAGVEGSEPTHGGHHFPLPKW